MKVIVDWKFFAAHRAAKCYHASADSKLDFVIAFLAIHILHSARGKANFRSPTQEIALCAQPFAL